MQHPLGASNDNASSTLDLYLFKGTQLSRHFQSHQSRFHGVVPNRRKTLGFIALALAKGSVASIG